MPQDPYFNKISLQLIQTPRPSAQRLANAARGGPVRNAGEAGAAVQSATGWLHEPFTDDHRPPEDVQILAFPQENGLCDVVRAAFSAGGHEVEVAQSKYMLSIRIKGYSGGGKAVELAESVAKEFLQHADRVSFQETGTLGPRTIGQQLPADDQKLDPQWPHWFDRLRWWVSKDEVGFVTVKALGGPTREVISTKEDLNRNWFK